MSLPKRTATAAAAQRSELPRRTKAACRNVGGRAAAASKEAEAKPLAASTTSEGGKDGRHTAAAYLLYFY